MTRQASSVASALTADQQFAAILEQLTARLQAGEPIDIDQLTADHPEHAERLRQLLPAMQLLADASRPDGPSLSVPVSNGLSDEITEPLGDFRLIREVGRGGMGIVYEAEQISLSRRVALKVLPFAGAMDPKQIQRFKNEAKAAASLKHDHIVSVHAIGCERGVHFYAMEFIDGQTLAQFIADWGLRIADSKPIAASERQTAAYQFSEGSQSAPPPIRNPKSEIRNPTKPIAALSTEQGSRRDRAFFRWAAELIAQAADALEHAHSLGIVHRDVKPGNLLLDTDGQVYVSDFGLARLGADAGLTISGDLVGTLRYMAPEQALARHGLVDHRADVYGLGCTLYELLTGRPAVNGTDRADILRAIAFEEPTPLRKLDKSIPAELETITLKCLAKNPSDRYATAGEVADDLRRWLGDHAIKAKPPGLREKVAKLVRRFRAVVTTVVVALLLFLIAGVLGVLIGNKKLRTEKEFAQKQKSVADEQKAISDAALDFVESKLIAAARPEGEEKGLVWNISLREALEKSLPFLDQSFSDQPLVEARLRLAVGRSFHSLGNLALALQHLERACLLYRQYSGSEAPETLDSTAKLAACLYDLLILA